MIKEDVDYLLVNAANRFLLEYTPIEENSCYNLTGFTGDTGDALIMPDGKIKLFVDGRYHIQADLEVDKTKVEVVKLKLSQKADDEICKSIKSNSTLGITWAKVSELRYEYIKNKLKNKNITVIALDTDIYEKSYTSSPGTAVLIPIELSGKSFFDKIKNIKKPALITNSEELSYLCNIRDFSQNYAVKVNGKLLLCEDKNILFTDTKVQSVDFEVLPLKDFDKYIKGTLCSIAVDKTTINAKDYSMIKFPVPQISPVKKMKAIKNNAEIKHLKYCFEMTDKALYDTRNFIYANDNLSEYDINIELEKNFKKYGAKLLSFRSIVAKNQNAAQAHYMKSSEAEIIKEGDLVLIDCGGYYEGGLATDITRVFVKGNPCELQKKVYTTVLKMFLNAYKYRVMEGITTGYEIDKYTRKIFAQNPVADFAFTHGLGHGIGICVHEAPPNLSMNETANTPLENNMCFTIEPGIYFKDKFGIRLENSCYLEAGEIKSFSNMCYEKKLIDCNMLNDNEIETLKEFRVE